MDKTKAAELLSENLKNIFAFSFSRLYDKTDAEDLTNDIVVEVLCSVHRLKDDNTFNAFMWRIADNTFKKFIRKKKLNAVAESEEEIGVDYKTPESEYIRTEEISLLRRELSLLSKQYREVTVLYYFRGKTVTQIASELNISKEMVKYYLFKTRQIIKEGFGMNRTLGEKSYSPASFKPDFWGWNSYPYMDGMFKRRLPGNIVLAAYNAPVDIKSLCNELGVSAPYLEDEIDILLEYEILRKVGDKVQTDIVIFTEEYDNTVALIFQKIANEAAEKLIPELDEILPEMKKYNLGIELDENALKWFYANRIVYVSMNAVSDEVIGNVSRFPLLPNGSRGYVFGYDNDYKTHHFEGIYGEIGSKSIGSAFSVINYRILKDICCWKPQKWEKSTEAMCAAVSGMNADVDNDMIIKYIDEGFITSENGTLKANFPTIEATVLQKLNTEEFAPSIAIVRNAVAEICESAKAILKKNVPDNLKVKCDELAYVRHEMDAMAYIVESLVNKGYLTIPEKRRNLTILGIKY